MLLAAGSAQLQRLSVPEVSGRPTFLIKLGGKPVSGYQIQ